MKNCPIEWHMSTYRVLLNGENFLIEWDGQPSKTGFYTTRVVEADNPDEAETIAVEIIKQDARLRSITLNGKEDSPMIYVDEIEEVSSLAPGENTATGFAFYPEDGGESKSFYEVD